MKPFKLCEVSNGSVIIDKFEPFKEKWEKEPSNLRGIEKRWLSRIYIPSGRRDTDPHVVLDIRTTAKTEEIAMRSLRTLAQVLGECSSERLDALKKEETFWMRASDRLKVLEKLPYVGRLFAWIKQGPIVTTKVGKTSGYITSSTKGAFPRSIAKYSEGDIEAVLSKVDNRQEGGISERMVRDLDALEEKVEFLLSRLPQKSSSLEEAKQRTKLLGMMSSISTLKGNENFQEKLEALQQLEEELLREENASLSQKALQEEKEILYNIQKIKEMKKDLEELEDQIF